MKTIVSIALTRRLMQRSNKEPTTRKNRNRSGALQVYSPEAKNMGLKGCVVGNLGISDGDEMRMKMKSHLFRSKISGPLVRHNS
jgi:hypothetical protein